MNNNEIVIMEIINTAISDLEKYENNGVAPALKPDYPKNYSRPWDRSCYISRYIYAYTYEYIRMYLNVINMGIKEGPLRVLSVGCGVMSDAWALEEALKIRHIDKEVKYVGIDNAEWEERYSPKTEMDSTIKKEDAGEYLLNCDSIDYDIILFPKSLRDIWLDNVTAFDNIKRALTLNGLKEEFYILFSFPDYKRAEDLAKDQRLAKTLVDCVINRGYSCIDYKENEIKNERIDCAMLPFPLPSHHACSKVNELTDRNIMTHRSYEHYCIYRIRKIAQ